jgi:hypothetical protein
MKSFFFYIWGSSSIFRLHHYRLEKAESLRKGNSEIGASEKSISSSISSL